MSAVDKNKHFLFCGQYIYYTKWTNPPHLTIPFVIYRKNLEDKHLIYYVTATKVLYLFSLQMVVPGFKANVECYS